MTKLYKNNKNIRLHNLKYRDVTKSLKLFLSVLVLFLRELII